MHTSPFGTVIQHAFVVKDMDAALAYWIDVMGVGPFYQIEDATYRSALYRNEPSLPRYSVALAYWGETQIELVTPLYEDPSIYKEFLDQGHDGLLHHMCVTVPDMDEFLRDLNTENFETLAELTLDPVGRVLYLRGKGQPWPLMEVAQLPSAIYELFDRAKSASINWDGKNPIRSL